MGQQYLADSNTLIDYVGNKLTKGALIVLDSYFNDNIAISIITKIEVLGFNGDENETKKLTDFIGLARIFYIDDDIADKTIELRKSYKIKTPDAIIAATALVSNLMLCTRNIADFKTIDGLQLINPWDL